MHCAKREVFKAMKFLRIMYVSPNVTDVIHFPVVCQSQKIIFKVTRWSIYKDGWIQDDSVKGWLGKDDHCNG